jgi:site-specific DNA recombinase
VNGEVVALYCRLSPRPDGSYEGVDLQERWGRDYAARTWPGVPIEVFADRGIGAGNGDHRPEFERLREWLRDGRIGRLWTVEQSRLTRREVEWFELAAEMYAAGIEEVHSNRDGIVRVLDEVAGIKSVLSAAERRRMIKRVNETLDGKARAGEPGGGRPYGYRRATKDGTNNLGEPIKVKTLEIVPEQAEIIREAADRVLSGWSLGSIAADFSGRGLRAPHGGPMVGEAVRRILTTPTVAGKRKHGDRIHPGNWPSILDERAWEEVKARLTGPRAVRRADGSSFSITEKSARRTTLRRYLITGGLTVCGRCETSLHGSSRPERLRKSEDEAARRKVAYLQCLKARGGCGKLGIKLPETERYVTDRLFAELDRPEFLDAVAVDDQAARRDELLAELGAIERKREQQGEQWAADEISDSAWRAAERRLDEREQEARAALAAVPPPLVSLPDVTVVRELWDAEDGMTLDEKRAFLRLFIEKITIHPAERGTHKFDGDRRVEINWLYV